MGINGEGIAYYQRKPVFIPGAFVHETVDVSLKQGEGNYYEGTLNRLLLRSEERIRRKCPNSLCDSCPFIEMTYEAQLEYKTEIFKETLERYCDTENVLLNPVEENPLRHCRNMIKLPLTLKKGKITLGSFQNGSNRAIAIHDCYVQDERLNSVADQVLQVLNADQCRLYQRNKEEGLRYLLLRGFEEEYQLTLVSSSQCLTDKTIEKLREIKEIVSIYESAVTDRQPKTFFKKDIRHLYGRRKIKCRMGEYTFFLSPSAFFQLNIVQAEKMYRLAASYLEKGENVLDAYCGIGSMTLFLAETAGKVTGVENNYQAIADAKKNAEYNHINNVEFIAGDAAAKLKMLNKKTKFDTIVLDPPRSGLDDSMLDALMDSGADKIVYVSCNPATLAKNLQILQNRYEVRETTPFDLFSETALIESVSYLKRKRGKGMHK